MSDVTPEEEVPEQPVGTSVQPEAPETPAEEATEDEEDTEDDTGDEDPSGGENPARDPEAPEQPPVDNEDAGSLRTDPQ